ncbi:MAG: FKBP-type peptidyl-prolyl cis-trans isomerase [Candidatus Brocadiales bacterium]
MSQAKIGDTVKVHYCGTLEDGSVFDSSREREPFEFTIGQKMAIPGFEKTIVGMEIGETKTVSFPPEDAYGPYKDGLLVVFERSQVPPDTDPQVGMKLQLRSPEGMAVNAVVTNVTEDKITFDVNHPLAGKALKFEIQLLEIL